MRQEDERGREDPEEEGLGRRHAERYEEREQRHGRNRPDQRAERHVPADRDDAEKDRCRDRDDEWLDHGHRPDRARHAAAAVEAQENRPGRTQDRGGSDERNDEVRGAGHPREDHGHGALAYVEQAGQQSAAPAHGAQRVRTAGSAAADGSRVTAAGQARHKHAHGHGSAQIAEEDEERVAHRVHRREYREDMHRFRVRLLICGLLAAGPALLVLVAGRAITSRPGFLEAVANGFVRFLPLELFEAAVGAVGPWAKASLSVGVAAGVLAAGTLFAPLALRVAGRRGRRTEIIAVLVLAIAELVVLPLLGGGLFGTALGFDEIPLHVPLALASLAYALVLVRVADPRSAPAAPSAPETQPFSRRTFVGRAAAVGLLSLGLSSLAIVGQAVAAARRTGADPDANFPPGGFGPTHAQTPIDRFYVVHKDLLAPVVDAGAWRLQIDGLVDAPASLTLDELRALPSLTAYRTLECISTSIVRGDDLIGNQKWRGVPVSDLLARVGPQPAAAWILWEAEDGFTESIPLEVARHPDTWIAYEMGDAPLTADHGFPARVLIPGRFGMKQPKWVRRMTLAAENVPGYWEQRGWDEQAIVRTMSRIDWPRPGDTVVADERFGVYGIAFAGDRGVDRVEVSADGGLSWQDAELEDMEVPPLGQLTWVRWKPDDSLGVGGARLTVRATDGTGAVQDGRETSPLPSGSTGWHAVRVVAA